MALIFESSHVLEIQRYSKQPDAPKLSIDSIDPGLPLDIDSRRLGVSPASKSGFRKPDCPSEMTIGAIREASTCCCKVHIGWLKRLRSHCIYGLNPLHPNISIQLASITQAGRKIHL